MILYVLYRQLSLDRCHDLACRIADRVHRRDLGTNGGDYAAVPLSVMNGVLVSSGLVPRARVRAGHADPHAGTRTHGEGRGLTAAQGERSEGVRTVAFSRGSAVRFSPQLD